MPPPQYTHPTTGEVALPHYLDRSGVDRTYGLPYRKVSLYITVLRGAGPIEDLHYLNWSILVDMWPTLRISTGCVTCGRSPSRS